MTDAKPATHWRPQHGRLCTINSPWAEKKACDCGLAETLMITLGHDELRIDTERAARLATEARVKVLRDALTNLLAAIEGGAPVAANTTDLWNARLAEARAALKEPANG